MKKLIFLTILGILFTGISAQNLLKFQWKFSTGDDPSWSDPSFNDNGWAEISSGILWETQGFMNYDGYAWYRQTVLIPSRLKADAEKNGGLVLYLGLIDDADYTWFNGTLVGKNGEFPPDYLTAYDKQRTYLVPTGIIKWDEPNVIAIKVYDSLGGGGIIGDKIGLFVKGLEEQLSIKPVFKQEDHIFRDNVPINIPVKVTNHSKSVLKGSLMLKVVNDFGKESCNMLVTLSLNPGIEKTVNLEPGNLAPGFYNSSVIFASEDENKKVNFSFGVRPEEIVSPADRPDDFDDYWKRAKRELYAVDPQFKMIRQEELCTPEKDMYLIEMRSLGNILIRGWYSKPVKPGKYPAILQVQGYSSVMVPEYTYQDADIVSFGLNIRGHGNSRDNYNPGFPGYLLHNLNDKELYVYRGAYMDCLRAVDFLCSQDCVDTARIAVEGGSQGGALSFATAALDPRIDLCVPAVPFLSDFRDYFVIASWPGGEVANYLKANPDISEDLVYRNLSYIDIKNLAPWIRVPVLMSVGLIDLTCPPHINFAAYNLLSSEKEYKVYPESGHGLPAEYYKFKLDWIRKKFGLPVN